MDNAQPEDRPPSSIIASGDDLLAVLSALASVHRLRILAALVDARKYVSQLARDLAMNRTLLHMHLQRMEAAGLVIGKLELSDSGKAIKYYDVSAFSLYLTPEIIADLTRRLGPDTVDPKDVPEGERP